MATRTANSTESRSAYRPALERSLFALAILGLLLTAHLSFWYGAGAGSDDPVCGVGFDCQAVIASDPAPLGVSSTIWGLLFYVGVAALCVGIAIDLGGRRSLFSNARMIAVGGGFMYSVFLTAYQIFALSDRCLLCLVSASLVTAMAAILWFAWRKPAGHGGAGSVQPSRELRFHAVAGVIFLALFLVDYGYFRGLPGEEEEMAVDEVVDPSLCSYDTDTPYFTNLDQFIEDYDPIVGRPDAAVTIMEFLDPNCPHCKTLHPVMKRVVAKFPDHVRIVYKPVTIVGGPTHSLDEVVALWLAEEEGEFEGMLERLFAHQEPQTGLSIGRLTELAREAGISDARFRQGMDSRRLEPRARRIRQIFDGLGLTGVPAVIIEGRLVHTSSRSVGCLSHFVEQALSAQDMSAE